MNPDLIESREDALALVDADLITIQDYVALCGFKGWNAASDTAVPVSARLLEPANRNEPPPSGAAGPGLLRPAPARPRVKAGIARTEPGVSLHAQSVDLSITSV